VGGRPRYREALNNGKYKPKPPEPPLFGVHAEKWYINHVAHNLKYSTQISYRKQLDQHILPVFGEMLLPDIKRADIKQTDKAYAFLKPGNQEATNRLYAILTSPKPANNTQTSGVREETVH